MEYILEFFKMYMWQFILIATVFLLIMTFSLWKIFEKAKVDGYKSLIPIYNIYIWLDIAELPMFLIPIFFIPGLNILIFWVVSFKLGTLFDKNLFFKLGMCILPFIFYPILGIFKSLYKAEEEKGYVNPKDRNTTMYNQFPDVSVEEVVTDRSLGSTIVSPVKIDEFKEENSIQESTMASLEGAQVVLEKELDEPVENTMEPDDDLVLDIDSEDETWNDDKILTETEQTLKVVSIDPLADDPLFNPNAKPIKVASLDKYKMCDNCGTRLGIDAEICFLCGKQFKKSEE